MYKLQQGFSLLELLITVLIIVLATAIGLPSYNSFVTENNVVTYTNEVVRTLNIARSEAVKRGEIVTICKSAQSSPSCDSTRDWKDGWTTFVDLDVDNVIDNNEVVIDSHAGVSSILDLNSSGVIPNTISYRPDGRINTISGSFSICSNTTHSIFRRVIIANTGRIRTDDSGNYIDYCS